MKSTKKIQSLLRSAGHSGAKALEMAIDARRGDEVSRYWVGIHFRNRHLSRRLAGA